MTDQQQGDTLRAAQIQAVRQVLLDGEEDPINDLAAEVVDAVLAAGGLCGQTSESLLLGHPPLVCTMPAGYAGRWHQDDDGSRWTPRDAQSAPDGLTHPDLPTPPRSGAERAGQPLTRRAYDQAEARGYAQAVANLRSASTYKLWHRQIYDATGVWRFEGDEDQHFERVRAYLKAVGPEGAGRIIGYVHATSLEMKPGTLTITWTFGMQR